MKCKHCGDAVIFTGSTAQGYDTDYVHANMIRRCLPERSGKPYGIEADYEEAIRLVEGPPGCYTRENDIDLDHEEPEPQDRWSLIEKDS